MQDDWEGREVSQRLTIMKYDAAFPVRPLDKDILKSEQSETKNFNETQTFQTIYLFFNKKYFIYRFGGAVVTTPPR